MHRTRLTGGAVAAMVAAALFVVPSGAAGQAFPVFGKDKWLGSVNELTRPQFTQYFNEVTPENAGKWGSAAGTTRTAAMRWANLDQAYNFAQANGFPFNFHVLVWGNQQPTWMAALPHLPAFSGVTSLKYCVNSGRVSSLTLPSHLSFPNTGNACPAAPDGTTKSATATMATTAPPVRRVRCIAPSPPLRR